MASPVLFSIAAATTAIAPAIFSAFASPSVVVVVPGTAINPLLGGAVVVGAAITALTRSNLRLKLAQVFRAQSADPEDLNQGAIIIANNLPGEEIQEEAFDQQGQGTQYLNSLQVETISSQHIQAQQITINVLNKLLVQQKQQKKQLVNQISESPNYVCELELELSESKKKIVESDFIETQKNRKIEQLENQLSEFQQMMKIKTKVDSELLESKLKTLNRKVGQAEKKIAKFTKEIGELEKKKQSHPLAKENREHRSKITKLQKNIEDLEEDRKKKSKEITELEAKIVLLMDKSLLQCQICFSDTEISNRRLHPCGHMMCATCAPQINRPPQECPFCKQKFTEIKPFHF